MHKGTTQVTDENYENECPSIKKGLKTKHFWIIYLMTFFSFVSAVFVKYNYKDFGIQKINDDEFLSIVGSVSNLLNGGFRFA